MTRIDWPDQKLFAFTIFDDTDNARLEDVRIVYDFLLELGFRTTKSVWVLDPDEEPRIGGENLTNRQYLDYCLELARRGVEIALHNVSAGHNLRGVTEEGIRILNDYLDRPLKSFANHADNKENIYWGGKRLSGMYRRLFEIIGGKAIFEGDDESSPYFWGDLCKKNIQYVRNFVFEDINTLKKDPFTPYYDSRRPYVNRWFSSSNASEVHVFNKNVTRESLLQLEEEGGGSILYTHFCSFVKNGRLNREFVNTMEYLANRPGWFVPVSEMLDYLEGIQGKRDISPYERFELETKWFAEQVRMKFVAKIKKKL